MADQVPAAGGNGSGETGSEPSVSILAQYTKDLSVENPSAPQVYQWQVQPNLDVQFNINVESVADDVHEIVLKKGSGEINRGGEVVSLSNFDKVTFKAESKTMAKETRRNLGKTLVGRSNSLSKRIPSNDSMV